jgi:aminoglycoside 6'-N-acetyltransferase I
MSSSFLVRPAERRDLANWAQMRAELWPCSSRQEHLAELEEGSKSTSFRGWVALSDDRCIGFAEAYIRPFANGCDSRPVVFLEGIWVGPDFRRCRTHQYALANVSLEVGFRGDGAGGLLPDETPVTAPSADLRSSLQRGRSVRPIRALSMACAACRPSRIAQTTSDWPRRMSPATNSRLLPLTR